MLRIENCQWSFADCFPNLFYKPRPKSKANKEDIIIDDDEAEIEEEKVEISSDDPTVYKRIHPLKTQQLDSMRCDVDVFLSTSTELKVAYLLFWIRFIQFMLTNQITHSNRPMYFLIDGDFITDSYYFHIVDYMLLFAYQFMKQAIQEPCHVRGQIYTLSILLYVQRFVEGHVGSMLDTSDIMHRWMHLNHAMLVLTKLKLREAASVYYTLREHENKSLCYWNLYAAQSESNLVGLKKDNADDLRVFMLNQKDERDFEKQMQTLNCKYLLQAGFYKAAHRTLDSFPDVRDELIASMDETTKSAFIACSKSTNMTPWVLGPDEKGVSLSESDIDAIRKEMKVESVQFESVQFQKDVLLFDEKHAAINNFLVYFKVTV